MLQIIGIILGYIVLRFIGGEVIANTILVLGIIIGVVAAVVTHRQKNKEDDTTSVTFTVTRDDSGNVTDVRRIDD